MADPAATLREIAERLERARETYKVRAFREAAKVVEETGAERLDELWRAGRLTSLPGVGESTAKVIAEVLAEGRSSYLEGLDVVRPAELSPAAAALRSAIRGDCHSHSNWSDGGSPIEEMAAMAKRLGHDYLVLTDHSPRLTVAHGLNRERLLDQLEVVVRVNEELAPFRLFAGIEVDIFEDGTLDQDDDLLERLDVVVASAHSKLALEKRAMTRRLIAAAENPRVDIIGHVTGRILAGRGRPESTFDPEAVFGACAASGTAVELNARPDRQDPRRELLELALELGCQIAIDTDSHAPGQLEWMGDGCALAAEAGVTAERVVNTLGPDELLAWAAAAA